MKSNERVVTKVNGKPFKCYCGCTTLMEQSVNVIIRTVIYDVNIDDAGNWEILDCGNPEEERLLGTEVLCAKCGARYENEDE